MRSSFLFFIVLLCFKTIDSYCQNPEIKTDLPQIVPPSPTVAALMKFEEVPVNNYTGIPDISIPLFSTSTLSPDISVNISLNYHSGSIAVDEVASFAGLGWNLIAGGTISRTVRGYPDELHDLGGGILNNPPRYGIYSSSNDYYVIYDLIQSSGLTTMLNSTIQQYIWEAVEKGWYDTEHDLYQYNFGGYSGRFIVKKNGALYEVVKLDNTNSLKIIYNSNNSFTIIDDKGYSYAFNIKETSFQNSYSEVTYYAPNGNSTGATAPWNPKSYSYISAYHLSEIQRDNNLLVEFKYNNDNEVITEFNKQVTNTSNILDTQTQDMLSTALNNWCYENKVYEQYLKIEPKTVNTFQTVHTNTKKLNIIEVINKAKIYFDLEDNRQDTDTLIGWRLKGMVVKNWADTPIKKFTFEHTYSEIISGNNRMVLSKVVEGNFVDTKTQEYELFYATPLYSPNIGRDYWGYVNKKPTSGYGIYKEATPAYCYADVLQKMTLPSGGAVVFDFGGNTYSYIGDSELTDFDANPDNWADDNSSVTFLQDDINQSTSFFHISEQQLVTVTAIIDFGSYSTDNWLLSIKDENNNEYTALDGHDCPSNCSVVINLPPGNYSAKFESFQLEFMQIPTFQVTATAQYKDRVGNEKYFYGGGVRINTIGYFEDGNVPQQYYQFTGYNEGYQPVKEKKYNYNFFHDQNRSSGSLAFPIPILEYSADKLHSIVKNNECPDIQWNVFPSSLHYTVQTSFNNLKILKTQGADVGYKNVTVYETGNGESRYTYTSPIDFPSIDSTGINPSGSIVTYPFRPAKNLDYKRGLLQNEMHFDKFSKLLSETLYIYDIDQIEVVVHSGFNPYSINGCPFASQFNTYSLYKGRVDNCGGKITPEIFIETGLFFPECYHCGYVNEYINFYYTEEVFGWPKLSEKITKNYFYTSGNVNAVSVKELFSYSNINKKITNYSKEIYNAGAVADNISSNYTYFFDPDYQNNNRISQLKLVKNYMGSELLSTQEINFSNGFANNTAYLPSTIGVSKGAGSQENRIEFLSYDQYSQPLEVKQVDGKTVSYIYGYNNSVPIAMVENASYAQVAAALGITTATLQGYDESDLSTINTLRTLLPSARITTYTYIPLVGVSSVTDVRGKKITYEYDSFGRLKSVRDDDGKLLSENEYHYRTQQ